MFFLYNYTCIYIYGTRVLSFDHMLVVRGPLKLWKMGYHRNAAITGSVTFTQRTEKNPTDSMSYKMLTPI